MSKPPNLLIEKQLKALRKSGKFIIMYLDENDHWYHGSEGLSYYEIIAQYEIGKTLAIQQYLNIKEE